MEGPGWKGVPNRDTLIQIRIKGELFEYPE